MGIKELARSLVVKTELFITVERLLEESSLNGNFFFHLIISSIIAAIGLLENNMVIVIGAMIIAPLLTPLLCLSLGIIAVKKKMIKYGVLALLLGSILGILTASITTILLGKTSIPAEIIDIYTVHNIEFLIIAFFTGMAGAFASLNPKKSEQLVGVAIAVALVPPLAFAGIALAIDAAELFKRTLALYALSILSTSLGAMIIYALHMLRNKLDTGSLEE